MQEGSNSFKIAKFTFLLFSERFQVNAGGSGQGVWWYWGFFIKIQIREKFDDDLRKMLAKKIQKFLTNQEDRTSEIGQVFLEKTGVKVENLVKMTTLWEKKTWPKIFFLKILAKIADKAPKG